MPASIASLTTFAEPDHEAPSLTFGKHRGVPLSEVETGYLEWVRTADRITPELLAAIDAVLATRKPKAQDRWRPPSGTPKDVIEMARLLLEAGDQELRAALGQDWRVDAARELLKDALNDVEMMADGGTLPF